MQPLRIAGLVSWAVLIAAQASLLAPGWGIAPWWPLLLILLLLAPLPGLLRNQRYTYKWIGFLTLIYICVGISEMVANQGLRLYATATILSSLVLFLSSIYQARYLGARAQMGSSDKSG